MLFTQAVYYGIQHPGGELSVCSLPFLQAAEALDAARRQLQTVSLQRTLHHLHVRPSAPPYLANRDRLIPTLEDMTPLLSSEILLFSSAARQPRKKKKKTLQAVGIVAPADE